MSDIQKFNANARLFNKDQLSKLLTELDIPVAAEKPAKKVVPKEPVQTVRQPQGSVEDILKQNFIAEEK